MLGWLVSSLDPRQNFGFFLMRRPVAPTVIIDRDQTQRDVGRLLPRTELIGRAGSRTQCFPTIIFLESVTLVPRLRCALLLIQMHQVAMHVFDYFVTLVERLVFFRLRCGLNLRQIAFSLLDDRELVLVTLLL